MNRVLDMLFVCVSAKEELFPVADATTFFTDLHYILRIIAAGNIRTLCHHRLNLLEQVKLLLIILIFECTLMLAFLTKLLWFLDNIFICMPFRNSIFT